ncbi:MAG: translation elongation factor-like protein [Candidatus Omnitrophota bacterium]
MANEEKLEEIGKITGFFTKVGAAIIDITGGSLKVGETVRIKGHTTDFEQVVESMQIEHQLVQEAKNGQTIGLKVKDRVRRHDTVYKVIA